MKKIIGGKKYDTATAEHIGEARNNLAKNDFNYFIEDLYRKKTGEFFLCGEGGPTTKYASQHAHIRGYGEKIIPVTHECARDWVAVHLEADDYESIFGEVSE